MSGSGWLDGPVRLGSGSEDSGWQALHVEITLSARLDRVLSSAASQGVTDGTMLPCHESTLLPRSHRFHAQGEVWKALIEKYGRAFFWSGVLKVRLALLSHEAPACLKGVFVTAVFTLPDSRLVSCI